MPSERFISSNGAFGLYDGAPLGSFPAGSLSLIGSLNSGLGNTWIVSTGVGSGSNLALKFGPDVGPHGRRFDTDISFGGALSAEFAGVSVDLASVEFAGDGFLINVGGVEGYYTADNLSVLTQALKDADVSDSVAENLTDLLGSALETIGELEDFVDALLDGLMGGGLIAVDVPTFINHDGNVEAWETFFCPGNLMSRGGSVALSSCWPEAGGVYFRSSPWPGAIHSNITDSRKQ